MSCDYGGEHGFTKSSRWENRQLQRENCQFQRRSF